MLRASICFLSVILLTQLTLSQKLTKKVSLTISYSVNHPSNEFRPSESLGAAFDGHSAGDMDRIFRKENMDSLKSVGLKPISYRLRTELAGEVWHWNTKGRWTNEELKEGYWISDSIPSTPILTSNGFRLPRRGNTHDQANDDGYSRIDDGDTTTFWKSNPYLDHFFTRENDSLHPQWVIIDLGANYNVNSLRILWSNPFALSFKVEYAFDIGMDYFDPFMPGLWHPFDNGMVNTLGTNNKIIRITKTEVRARFIKITMVKSSYTCDDPKDIRDHLGFSIKELEAGYMGKDNFFHDWIHHSVSNKTQTVIHVSSTDPWHRHSDIDINTEQAGIDRFYTSGLVSGSVMLPIGLLYDTPENMISLIKYLKAKKYPVEELEMGEEPEGQLVNPVDYASLYTQWSYKIKELMPAIKLGGPGFAALDFNESDSSTFSEREWTVLFLNYLKEHNNLANFNFFSTEWYPFDDICSKPAAQLAIQPKMMHTALKYFSNSILPKGIPIYFTEFGYSAYAGRPEVEIEGALMYADIIGQFLFLGGKKCFLYGYEPTYLDQTRNCDWGNNMIFEMNDSGKIIFHTAAYFGIRMITEMWAKPSDSILKVYPVSGNIRTNKNEEIVKAYALLKPGNKWSLMIINKNPSEDYDVDIKIKAKGKELIPFHFPVNIVQYSGLQYKWHNNKDESYPVLNLPPVEFKLIKKSAIHLPPNSLTIVEHS
jgi:hypothetical protein